MSKKGMEMSINIVVGLVLGIAMFIAGIAIFVKIFGFSLEFEDKIEVQTKEEINKVLDTGQEIYVPDSNIEVRRNSAHFWIGIRNIRSEGSDFRVIVTVQEPNPPNFNSSKILFKPEPFLILSHENAYANIAVDMRKVTEKVTLQIKVEIEHEGAYEPYAKPKLVTIQP